MHINMLYFPESLIYLNSNNYEKIIYFNRTHCNYDNHRSPNDHY